jgi:RNA polymerase sigma-70 factor (ECF subfamily)
MEAWLYRLTENKVIDFLRKTAADSKLKNIVWNNLQESKDEAEEYFQVREYNEIIQKAINELPPQRKLIYQLNREGGLNYQQIADELQLSRHTVKNQLFTAVQSIRKYISRNVKLFSTFF